MKMSNQAKVDLAIAPLAVFYAVALALSSRHSEGTKSPRKIYVEVAADCRDPRLPANKLH